MSQIQPKIIKTKISENIVNALAIGFIVPAIITSPVGLYLITVGALKYYFNKRDFKRETKRLEKKGFIALIKKDNGLFLKLLEKGRIKQKDIEFSNLILKTSKIWDRKWRLFTFDIPEEHRVARKLINKKLKDLGFYNIQKSVYIYPYKCKKELELITEHYKVSKYTTYAELNYIDVDKELRKYFCM